MSVATINQARALDERQLTIADACRALGIPEVLVRGWQATGVPLVAAGGVMTMRQVMQLALMDAYGMLGVDAWKAARWAVGFTDSGSEDRLPGALFDRDDTLLVARPGDRYAVAVKGEDFDANPPRSAVVLHVDPVIGRVQAAFAA